MKRLCLIILSLVVLLAGCGGHETPRPEGWAEDWTMVSPFVAVEPMEGFALNEANDTLSVSGIYYATWVVGQMRSHTNEDGEEAEVFDAQIYVLVQEFRSGDSAEKEIANWAARAEQSYETGEPDGIDCGGQPYTMLPLVSGSESNPYSHGMVAYGVHGKLAVWVELVARTEYEEDLKLVLEQFLSGFHYSA